MKSNDKKKENNYEVEQKKLKGIKGKKLKNVRIKAEEGNGE